MDSTLNTTVETLTYTGTTGDSYNNGNRSDNGSDYGNNIDYGDSYNNGNRSDNGSDFGNNIDYGDSYNNGNRSDYGNNIDYGKSSDYGNNFDNGNRSDNGSDYYSGFYDYYGGFDYGDEYTYPGFLFERPVYLFLWEFLVIFTSLVNVIVIYVLLQRKMRNSTNIILTAIAISNSLTGLVTLPSYIMVFQRFDSHFYYDSFPLNVSGLQYGDYLTHPYQGNSQHNGIYFQNSNHQGESKMDHLPTSGDQNSEGYTNLHTFPSSGAEFYPDSYMLNQHDYDAKGSAFVPNSTFGFAMMIPSSTHNLSSDSFGTMSLSGYILTKDLCRGFIISKYFLSKWFHTISIFLTLFLGIQRFISVAYPFKSKSMFSVTKTVVCCVLISLVSLILHEIYLRDEKASDGFCLWKQKETGCKGDCIYMWMRFFIRHFIPCTALIIFTALFIRELNKGVRNIRRININISQVSRRADENRRITIIVVAVVIVFLIPEVLNVVLKLHNTVVKTYNKAQDFETYRTVNIVYELLLVVSFHANFHIYTLFNRRFRKTLKRIFIHPIRRFFGDQRRFSISRTPSTSQGPVARKTDFTLSSTRELKELNTIDRSSPCKMDENILEFFIPKSTNRDSGDKSENVETKFMESVSGEITQNQESSDHDALNTNV